MIRYVPAGLRRGVFMCAIVSAMALGGCLAPIAIVPAEVDHGQPLRAEPVTDDLSVVALAAGRMTGAELTRLSTAEQLAAMPIPARDLADLAHRLHNGVGGAPGSGSTSPIAAVGDRDDFWVLDADTANLRQVPAELVYQNERVAAWVQKGEPYGLDALRTAAETFSKSTWPAVTTAFGREPSPGIDGDPRIHMLFASNLGRVGGYYLARDTVGRSVAPHSNEREMFYVNTDSLLAADSSRLDALLAHEFQHMIMQAHDPNEETWVNEGMSEVAEDVAGYPAQKQEFAWFVHAADTQLNAWEAEPAQNMPHYTAAYLFLRFLIERLGPETVATIVADPADGIEGLRRVTAARSEGTTFESLFAEWVASMADDYAHVLAHPGDFGFETITIDAAGEAGSVHNFATDYLPIDTAETPAGTLYFEGATESRVSTASAASGQTAWWSNRADMSDTRLTREFDLGALQPGQPLTMSASLWWDIEEDYDFGYVMASRNGEQWEILPGSYTRLPTNDGNSLGPGYTGLSGANGQGGEPAWLTDTFDLSAYAGGPLHVRFEYVTDDAVTRPGLHVDDVRIDAIGYFDDFESGAPGWESEGWLLSNGRLDQKWLLQIIEMEGDGVAAVHRFDTDDAGRAEIDLGELDPATTKYLAVSGLTEGTTEPAPYRITVR